MGRFVVDTLGHSIVLLSWLENKRKGVYFPQGHMTTPSPPSYHHDDVYINFPTELRSRPINTPHQSHTTTKDLKEETDVRSKTTKEIVKKPHSQPRATIMHQTRGAPQSPLSA